MCDASYVRVSLVDAMAPRSAFSPLLRELGQRMSGPLNGPAMREDSFALGVIAGRREAEEQYAEERKGLHALVAEAAALQPEPSEQLAALIATTVDLLVTQIVGSIVIDRDWLLDRIDRAVSIIADADEAHCLWLHPADAALLEGAALPLQLCLDPLLERGALRIGCSAGWIEESRAHHLAALRTELGLGEPA